MNRILKLILFSSLFICGSSNAAVTAEDLTFGSLKLGATLAEISEQYGDPLIRRAPNRNEARYSPFFLFESFKVYLGKYPGKKEEIIAFEILDSSLSTIRGIKIGDTLSDIEKKYESILYSRYFSSSGIFDHDFKDYSGVVSFREWGSEYAPASHLVFYFRNKKIVKILVHEINR